jgi:flagellar hook assembly protein FlgD
VLARGGHVTLDVFNIMGQKLRRLADGAQAAGMHQVEWDGADDGGHPAASGVYLYRLDVDGATVEARRMQLIR